MKKLLLLIAAAAALASPVAAQASVFSERVPFDSYVLACNGNLIHLTGQLLIVYTETSTPSGGLVASSHFQPQGVRGIDLVTGATFIGTGLTRDIAIYSPAGGVNVTYVNRFRIQATAGGESFIISEIYHVTINSNGVLTAFVDNFKASC